MVDFVKSVLKRVAVSLVTMALLFVLFIIAYAAIFYASMQPVPVDVEEDSFLVIALDRNIPDAPPQFTPSQAFFETLEGREPDMNLLSMLDTIYAAQSDDRIKGIFLAGNIFGQNYGGGFPAIGELRKELEEFRASGKPIIGYLENAGLRELYLYSVADTLYIHPMGGLSIPGLASQNAYFGEALERLGVGAQVVRVGDYKSGVEPFIGNEMSGESREQITAMVEDVWSRLADTISHARGISIESLNKVITEDPLMSAEEAIEAGLVDGALYYDSVLMAVADAGASDMEGRTFKQIPIERYAQSLSSPAAVSFETEPSEELPTIAVVYAEGNIVDGSELNQNVPGDWFARRLRDIRFDDTVKALVLRVNSPGGSAYASEVILRELELLNEKMPVVISMGSLAASGGYWISTANDLIMADENTITGSIGVYGILINFQELANKWGVYFDGVQTHQFGTIFSGFEEKSPEAMALVQEDVDSVYEDFLERVTRSTDIDDVDTLNELAGGRVWTGSQALDLGLVDKIGGIVDAIDEAADMAGIGFDYSLMEVPGAQTPQEMLFSLLSGDYSVRELGLSDVVRPKNDSLIQVVENVERLLDTQGIQARSPVVGLK